MVYRSITEVTPTRLPTASALVLIAVPTTVVSTGARCALFQRTSFVDSKRTTVEFLAIPQLDSLLSLVFCSHLNKGETA